MSIKYHRKVKKIKSQSSDGLWLLERPTGKNQLPSFLPCIFKKRFLRRSPFFRMFRIFNLSTYFCYKLWFIQSQARLAYSNVGCSQNYEMVHRRYWHWVTENSLIGPVPQITRFQCLNTFGWSQQLYFWKVVNVPSTKWEVHQSNVNSLFKNICAN